MRDTLLVTSNSSEVILMKRLIYSSNQISERTVIIEVLVDEVFGPVAAGDVINISNLDEYPYGRLRANFTDFIEDVFDELHYYDCAITGCGWSNVPNSMSYYIHFYPSDKNGEFLTTFLINMRLSDHQERNYAGRSRCFHDSYAEAHHWSDEEKQRHLSYSVAVDGRMFKSYFAARQYIHQLLKHLQDGDYEWK